MFAIIHQFTMLGVGEPGKLKAEDVPVSSLYLNMSLSLCRPKSGVH
jgi:hypothetical protein